MWKATGVILATVSVGFGLGLGAFLVSFENFQMILILRYYNFKSLNLGKNVFLVTNKF